MKFRRVFISALLIWSDLAAFASHHDTTSFKNRSFVLFTGGYRLPLNKSSIINSGHGLYLECGLNPGKFISQKTILGIYAGFAFQDKLYSTSFNKEFAKDYSEAIDKEKLSGIDSAIILSSASLFKTANGTAPIIPGCVTNSFHNYSMYYGIQFSLPCKFSPVIKLYKGTTRSYFQGDGKEKDLNIFELRRHMYGAELFLTLKNIKSKDHLQRKIGLSLYSEYCDFYRSSLYFYDGTLRKNLKLSYFTTNHFRTKYKFEFYSGIKLSFLLF